MNLLNSLGPEQKRKQKEENNVVLFGVPTSTAAMYEEREKEVEKKSFEFLGYIGIGKDELVGAQIT